MKTKIDRRIMMNLICAVIVCIVFSIGFGGILISITEKMESIFGVNKDLLKLYERIKELEVHVESLIKE
jgi:hypothetical protein